MKSEMNMFAAVLADDGGRGMGRLGDGDLWVLLAVVAGVIGAGALVAVLLRSRREAPHSESSSYGALAILEERFASGAIDADEFAARRSVLRGETPVPNAEPEMPAPPATEVSSSVTEEEGHPAETAETEKSSDAEVTEEQTDDESDDTSI